MNKQHSDVVVVFDGPPSHESGRFVEVENGNGEGVKTHHDWKQRNDGLWEIGPFLDLTDRERAALYLSARERSVDRSGAAWGEPLLEKFTEDEWAVLARKLQVKQ
jgi:hypothetical protein